MCVRIQLEDFPHKMFLIGSRLVWDELHNSVVSRNLHDVLVIHAEPVELS